MKKKTTSIRIHPQGAYKCSLCNLVFLGTNYVKHRSICDMGQNWPLSHETTKSITYTGQNISLNILKNLIGIEYIKLKRSKEHDKIGNLREHILDLKFVTVSYQHYTECIFIVRFTQFWEDQILNLLKDNKIFQVRPDGENWKDEYEQGIYTGNPDYEYYTFSDFSQLCEDAVIQRALEIEEGIWCWNKCFVMFKIEDIRFYEDGSISSIPFVRNQEEIEQEEIKQEKMRKDVQASNEYDRRHGSGFYDANSWMDDSENYWNID